MDEVNQDTGVRVANFIHELSFCMQNPTAGIGFSDIQIKKLKVNDNGKFVYKIRASELNEALGVSKNDYPVKFGLQKKDNYPFNVAILIQCTRECSYYVIDCAKEHFKENIEAEDICNKITCINIKDTSVLESLDALAYSFFFDKVAGFVPLIGI